MNTAGADEKWLAPGTVKRRNIRCERYNGGGQFFESGGELHCRSMQNFASFDAAGSSSSRSHGLANRCWIADRAEHDFSAGFVSNDIRGPTAADDPDVEGRGSEKRIAGQRDFANVLEDVQERMDRGVAEFRISGMCQLAACGEFKTQGPFASEC